MKHRIAYLLFIPLFIVCTIIQSAEIADKTFGKTFFTQRSQQSDTATYLVQWAHQINRCDMDCVYGSLAITPKYMRSFQRDELGAYFFFNGTNTMTFGSSNGTGVDVFARNFFLNDDFEGTVSAFPFVENMVIDFTLFLGLDEWWPGLYLIIDAPINWTQWHFKLEETITTVGTTIAANALGNTIAEPSPVNSIITAFNGQILNTALFPDLKEVLQFGRVNGRQSKARIADLEIAVGYNILCNECAYFGVNIRTIFPTGNRPEAVFLFEPIAGNGHHFEFGAGIDAHYEFWNSCNASFGVYFDGRIYHIFKTQQKRIFDLTTNGVGSYRLLLKKFTDPTTYAGEILFGPNILARDCRVRNDVHADLSVMFDVLWCGFTFDVGYNFWVRTKDKISDIEAIPVNTYAVAGGTTGTGGATANNTGSTGTTIKGSGPAPDATNIFIKTADLDLDSAAAPTAFSHKIFANFGYTWEGCEYTPFLGIGAAVEFSGRHNNALNQFEVWTKFGFSFS